MTTLEDLLRMKVDIGMVDKTKNVTPPFRVAVQDVKAKPDGVHFMIHPNGYDGETLDFIVKGNELIPLENEETDE